MQSCIIPRLPTYLVQELNVGTVEIWHTSQHLVTGATSWPSGLPHMPLNPHPCCTGCPLPISVLISLKPKTRWGYQKRQLCPCSGFLSRLDDKKNKPLKKIFFHLFKLIIKLTFFLFFSILSWSTIVKVEAKYRVWSVGYWEQRGQCYNCCGRCNGNLFYCWHLVVERALVQSLSGTLFNKEP